MDNNFQFRYVEFQPLEFDPNSYRSNLVSVLAYYAYIILGFDYDSFSPLGGTEFFQIAEKIVTNAQNASEPGWKPYDGSRNKNRYWLVKNVLDKEYEGVRRFIYEYNINGLDKMESKTAEARTSMAESLKLIQEVYREKPDPYMYLIQIILESKSDELVYHLFESISRREKPGHQILTEIDPANKNKYEKITAAKYTIIAGYACKTFRSELCPDKRTGPYSGKWTYNNNRRNRSRKINSSWCTFTYPWFTEPIPQYFLIKMKNVLLKELSKLRNMILRIFSLTNDLDFEILQFSEEK